MRSRQDLVAPLVNQGKKKLLGGLPPEKEDESLALIGERADDFRRETLPSPAGMREGD